MGMGAIGETTVLRETEDLLEIAGKLLWLHVEGAEAFDAWCIDQPPTLYRYHLRESGGMEARVVGIGNLGSAEVGAWHETVDEGGLPYPAVAAQEGDLAGKEGFQAVNALPCLCGDLQTLIAHGLVERDHHLLITGLVGIEQVGLVEDEDDGHAIGLGRSEEAVDEGGGGLRIVDGDNQQRLIDIGGDDVALLGEIDALADDVVATVLDVSNE